MPNYKLPRAYRALLAEAGRKGGKMRGKTQSKAQLREQARKAGIASGAARKPIERPICTYCHKPMVRNSEDPFCSQRCAAQMGRELVHMNERMTTKTHPDRVADYYASRKAKRRQGKRNAENEPTTQPGA